MPYFGLYADYYFSSDSAVLLLPTQFVQGWAARATAGVSYEVIGGAKILIGGEVGGLGRPKLRHLVDAWPRQRAVLSEG